MWRWEGGGPELTMHMKSTVDIDGGSARVLEGLRRLAPPSDGSAPQTLVLHIRDIEPGTPLVPGDAEPMRSGPLASVPLMAGLQPMQDRTGRRYLSWADAGVLSWRRGAGVARLRVTAARGDLGWMLGCLGGTGL